MFRHAMLFSLLCATATGVASATVTQRKTRSIWPFSSSDASAAAAISGEHALLLEQAGLDKSFNLSSHPLWKIHKYHGIDLKPVQIETEIIKSKTVNGGENQSTSLGFDGLSSADESSAPTTELADLSFLNDLGGLADFLPDPEEDEASELIAGAIEKEESSHPGFFKRLWWRIWGTPESLSASKNSATKEVTAPSTLEFLSSLFGFAQSQQATKEEGEDGGNDEDSLTVYLPETQGSYMAVVLPSEKGKHPLAPQQNSLLPSQAVPPLFRETVTSVSQALEPPSNHANQYRDGTGVTAVPAAIEHVSLPLAKPVAQWPVAGATGSSASQAWIQSWTPHAAYTVHVQGPSSQWQPQQSEAEGLDHEQPSARVPAVSHSWTPSEDESRVQPDQSNSRPSSNLEPPAAVETNYNSAELSSSWPQQVLTQDVPPVFEASESTRGEQQASRKTSQDLAVDDEEERNQEQNQQENREKNLKENQDVPSPTAGRANDQDKIKDILSHFRIPEGLMKKLQVSQTDVDTILNDKQSAARAAERLRSLQKEFEMRKEQLSYVYATRVKKQTN